LINESLVAPLKRIDPSPDPDDEEDDDEEEELAPPRNSSPTASEIMALTRGPTSSSTVGFTLVENND
jgi:hypothetical protein